MECHRCSTISSAWEARGRSNPRPACVLARHPSALRPVYEPCANRRARCAPSRAQVAGAESLLFAAAAGGGCTRPRGGRVNGTLAVSITVTAIAAWRSWLSMCRRSGLAWPTRDAAMLPATKQAGAQ